MIEKISAMAVVLFLAAFTLSKCSDAAEHDDTALWLARSCIGEAGYHGSETGECQSIWHIYRKRAQMSGMSISEMARKYSSPLKRGNHSVNHWVRYLSESAEMPLGWPIGLKWDRYVPDWLETLERAKEFVSDPSKIQDPTPQAVHFGSRIDPDVQENWIRLKTPGFHNLFYGIRGLKF